MVMKAIISSHPIRTLNNRRMTLGIRGCMLVSEETLLQGKDGPLPISFDIEFDSMMGQVFGHIQLSWQGVCLSRLHFGFGLSREGLDLLISFQGEFGEGNVAGGMTLKPPVSLSGLGVYRRRDQHSHVASPYFQEGSIPI